MHCNFVLQCGLWGVHRMCLAVLCARWVYSWWYSSVFSNNLSSCHRRQAAAVSYVKTGCCLAVWDVGQADTEFLLVFICGKCSLSILIWCWYMFLTVKWWTKSTDALRSLCWVSNIQLFVFLSAFRGFTACSYRASTLKLSVSRLSMSAYLL